MIDVNNIKVAQINNMINNLKTKLANTDYMAIKFAEGELTTSEYAVVREKRKQWRNAINELEKQLKV